MKYVYSIAALILCLALCFSTPLASALGFSYWDTSSHVAPGETACFTYGVYNSDSSSVSVVISAKGDIKQFAVSGDDQTVQANAGTTPVDSTRTEVCFKMPSSCSVGDEYSGNVFVLQVPPEGISGSAASVGAAAPLTLICGEEASDEMQPATLQTSKFNYIYPTVAVFLALLILFIIFRKMMKSSFQNNSSQSQQQIP